jgi:aminoglycoside phosphotransferase (APT) family kinase protein
MFEAEFTHVGDRCTFEVLVERMGLDDPGLTALVLEDLTYERWPPPWRRGEVDAVLRAVGEVAETTPPDGLPPVRERTEAPGWEEVERDPEPFLSTGVCSRSWLEAALPALRAAVAEAPLEGDGFLHCDVRSDNVCVRDGRALLVDWNWACVGNPVVDVAAWLPSLHLEGGPPPEEVLPDEGGLAAWLAGSWAACAGLAPPPGAAPEVRRLQAEQAAVALRWAAGALDLPPPRMTGFGGR